MRDLIRAATQLTAEVIIYACQRVLEHLAAERPMLDDPLPDGHCFIAIDRGASLPSFEECSFSQNPRR